MTADDLRALTRAMQAHADEQLDQLAASLDRLDDRRREIAMRVLARRDDLVRQLDDVSGVRDAGGRIRCHGDYHLGQVIVTEGDVMILDFEGEPARPLSARRAKCSPLRDVAGMLRSFSYAALTGARRRDRDAATKTSSGWRRGRMRGKRGSAPPSCAPTSSATKGAAFLPARPADLEALLQLFMLDKALYELGYELNNRPDWVHIPLAGLLRVQARIPLPA